KDAINLIGSHRGGSVRGTRDRARKLTTGPAAAGALLILSPRRRGSKDIEHPHSSPDLESGGRHISGGCGFAVSRRWTQARARVQYDVDTQARIWMGLESGGDVDVLV